MLRLTKGSSSLHQVLEFIVDRMRNESLSLGSSQVAECFVRLVERSQFTTKAGKLVRDVIQVDLLGRDQGSCLALQPGTDFPVLGKL